MPTSFSRLELYNLLWANPMKKVVEDYGVAAADIRQLAEKADLPLPGPGHCTLIAMGRQVERSSLHPNIELDGQSFDIAPRIRGQRQIPKKDSTDDKAREAKANKVGEPASEPIVVTKEALRPIKISRDELYELVWQTPMVRLAETFGVSGNGLAKICDRLDIPYPPRGYWAKLAVKRPPARTPLPNNTDARKSVTIRPSPTKADAPSVPEDLVKLLETVRSKVGETDVPERLSRPHPVIAKWIEERRLAREKAKSDRRKGYTTYDPGPFSDIEQRQHQILDATFKSLERAGVRVSQESNSQILAEHSGEKIELRIREKQKQVKVPLTDDDKRWDWYKGKEWKRQTVGTGFQIIELQRYLPNNLPRSWLESDVITFDQLIPQIVSTIVVAGPLLAEESRQRAEEERKRRDEERQRYTEREAQKLDHNRFRYLIDLAEKLDSIRKISLLLRNIRQNASENELVMEIGNRSLKEWISWAEDASLRNHPLTHGTAKIFEEISKISAWD